MAGADEACHRAPAASSRPLQAPSLVALCCLGGVCGCPVGRPGAAVIVYVPFLLFALGAVIAYGSAGRRRQLGTIVMIVAAAWSLALIGQPQLTAWAVGPVLATLLLGRP